MSEETQVTLNRAQRRAIVKPWRKRKADRESARAAAGADMAQPYTSYMTIKEAQAALHILEVAHAARLMQLHLGKHQRAALRNEVLFGPQGALFSGALVRQLAECPDCFTALTAARTDNTQYTVEQHYDPEHL